MDRIDSLAWLELAAYSGFQNSFQGKKKVTVRFRAVSGSELAAVFGIRKIRADAGR